MENKILAKFRYNKKTYVFYLDEAGKVLYGYYAEGNKILNINTEEELFLINEVSKQIFVSNNPNNHVKFNTLNHKGKLYQLMFDKISGLRFLYEIKEGKYCVPNLSDVGDLLKIYNDGMSYIKKTSKKLEKIKNFKFKKTVMIGSVIVLVTIFSLEIFYIFKTTKMPIKTESLSYETILPTKEILEYEYFATPKPSIEFSIDKIIRSMKNNPNLTDAERKFFYQYNSFLVDNSKYINMDILLPKLSGFKIKYSKYKSNVVLAWWDGKDINICDSSSIYNVNLQHLLHEYLHIYQADTKIFGKGLFEATGEIISHELIELRSNEYSWKYFNESQYVKMLCEIISPEAFIAHYLTGDLNYVIDELKKIIPDENKALQLINFIDMPYGNHQKYIFNSIADYFYASKGYRIEEDAIMMFYNRQIENTSPNIFIVNDEKIKKGYFSKEYISLYPEATIEIRANNIILTEENRRFSGQRDKDGNFILDNEFFSPANVR